MGQYELLSGQNELLGRFRISMDTDFAVYREKCVWTDVDMLVLGTEGTKNSRLYTLEFEHAEKLMRILENAVKNRQRNSRSPVKKS